MTLHDAADSATPLAASYQAGSSWGTGYSGQYTITNPGTTAVTGWTLAFTLPKGTALTSLWDGSYIDDGGQVTVTADSWDATVGPGAAVTVGFVTQASGAAGQPAGCTINGAPCQAGGSARGRPDRYGKSGALVAVGTVPVTDPEPLSPPLAERLGHRRPPRRPGAAPAARGVPRRARRRGPLRPARPDSPRTSTRACSRRSAWSRRPRRPA